MWNPARDTNRSRNQCSHRGHECHGNHHLQSQSTGADPLVETGIGEEDFVTIILPYIHSAREGVLYTAKLLEQYGTYEMSGIGFSDPDEVWYLETIGGHHWMARRCRTTPMR